MQSAIRETMAEDGEVSCARLCRLLGCAFRSLPEILHSLKKTDYEHPSLTSVPIVLTLEMEKDLLISLTLVTAIISDLEGMIICILLFSVYLLLKGI